MVKGSATSPKITSPYGWRIITLNGRKGRNFHRGEDRRSPYGAEVVALFSGVVIKAIRGRKHGALIGRYDGNIPPLASTVSGNGVIVRRDNGSYYLEVHCSPTVDVGQRVTAGVTVLGTSDTSGQAQGAHRHIELWGKYDANTYYDPHNEIETAFNTEPESDDDMSPAQEAKLDRIITLLEQIESALGTGVATRSIGETVGDMVPRLAQIDNALATGNARRSIGTAVAEIRTAILTES